MFIIYIYIHTYIYIYLCITIWPLKCGALPGPRVWGCTSASGSWWHWAHTGGDSIEPRGLWRVAWQPQALPERFWLCERSLSYHLSPSQVLAEQLSTCGFCLLSWWRASLQRRLDVPWKSSHWRSKPQPSCHDIRHVLATQHQKGGVALRR